MPRWGKVGKQKIEDEGPLAPFPNMKDMQNWQEGRKAKYDMETFDDVLVKDSEGFMDKAKRMASHSSSGTTRHACMSSPISRRSTRR